MKNVSTIRDAESEMTRPGRPTSHSSRSWLARAAMLGVAVAAALACTASPGEEVASTGQRLNSLASVAYTPTTRTDHMATTSTVTVQDATCAQGFRTTTAWEEEPSGSTDQPLGFYLANVCGFNPMNVAQQGTWVTTAMTGTPPEWIGHYPSNPMVWAKEPQLVPLIGSGPSTTAGGPPNPVVQWIALVGQVGKASGIPGSAPQSDDIAIVLSQDGGQSWGNPHLVSDFASGKSPSVDDLAATASLLRDDVAAYPAPEGYYDFNTGTADVFVSWEREGSRWLDIVSFSASSPSAWALGLNFVAPVALPTAIFTASGGSGAVHNVSLVAGQASASAVHPNIPFVLLQWPNASQTGVDCSSRGTLIPNQFWHTAIAYEDVGTGHMFTDWTELGHSHPPTLDAGGTAVGWPTCVGFLPPNSGSPPDKNYRNPPRSSLAFHFLSRTVVDAVAVLDPTLDGIDQMGSPHPYGTHVESNAYPITWPPTPLAPPNERVFLSLHQVSNDALEDQFLPAIGMNRYGGGAITYVDSKDDAQHKNQPTGLYGATTQSFRPTAGATAWSPAAVWLSPYGVLGVPAGLTPFYDTLGRHNSISNDTGWGTYWWTTFGGYSTLTAGDNTMQTATFADSF